MAGVGRYRGEQDYRYTDFGGSHKSTSRTDLSGRKKHYSMYGSLGRSRHEEGGGRDWDNSWRSRSSEPSERIGYKDFSTSQNRNCFRDQSTSSRCSVFSEDYSRIRTTGRDPYPLPPNQRKSPDLHSILVKPSSAQSSSSFNKLDLNSRTRSKSFLDINESDSSWPRKVTRPKRHQTLTFGVSEDDLENARSVLRSSRDSNNKRSSSRYSPSLSEQQETFSTLHRVAEVSTWITAIQEYTLIK